MEYFAFGIPSCVVRSTITHLLHCVGRLAIIHHTIAICVHAPMCVMYVRVVFTGLVVLCIYWFGVLYWTGVLNWIGCTVLVCFIYWTGLLYVPDWYWTGVLYVLDWCVDCTGLVCCMYWAGVLIVLDWCVVCTGLVCCMNWTGVLYVPN